MELKQNAGVEIVGEITAFNRTIVELKPDFSNYTRPTGNAFNRTIVELKQTPTDSMSISEDTFNRTIVELKPIWRPSVSCTAMLLIEPLWN